MNRRTLLLSLCTAATLLAAPLTHADTLDDIVKRGTLKVAVPQDFPPFGSVGTDLQPQGYDIDMARYLAKQMKLKLQLVPVTSANRVPYLQTDKVDLVISSLGKNPEREKVIDFSRAYAPFFLGVFGPKGAELKDAAALSGQDHRRDARRGGGHGADQARPARCQRQALRRQQHHALRLSVRPGAVCGHRQRGGGRDPGAQPAQEARDQALC